MYVIGKTINIMTLGGLALATGILVDDATVMIENIKRYLHRPTICMPLLFKVQVKLPFLRWCRRCAVGLCLYRGMF